MAWQFFYHVAYLWLSVHYFQALGATHFATVVLAKVTVDQTPDLDRGGGAPGKGTVHSTHQVDPLFVVLLDVGLDTGLGFPPANLRRPPRQHHPADQALVKMDYNLVDKPIGESLNPVSGLDSTKIQGEPLKNMQRYIKQAFYWASVKTLKLW